VTPRLGGWKPTPRLGRAVSQVIFLRKELAFEAPGVTICTIMKASTLFVTGLAGLTLPISALEIPRSVHRVAATKKAIAEATASKRGILWVLSDSSLKPT
jgi:hypothetical protein